MQVKVFEAKDMATGLKMVKEALGPDALILSTRTIRSGKFGMLGKPMMEITAAVDNGWQPQQPASRPQHVDTARPWPSPQRERFQEMQQLPSQEELSYQNLWSRPSDIQPDFHAERPARRQTSQEQPDLQRELAELRNMVKGLSTRLTGFDAGTPQRPYVEPEFTAPAGTTATDPVVGLLTGYGIHPETAQVVSRFTRDTIEKSQALSRSDLHRILKTAIARLFTTRKLLDDKKNGQRRISLIGPTGVGKTTTLAKIAAHYLSHHGGRIGLITIDTYRIAAVEQLKVYGEIMRLPLEVVIKPQEMQQALDKFSDVDLVLIDTAGRSPRSGLDIQELAAFLRPQLGIENNLMLSATTREREIEETIHRFSLLPISNFIFSKIDECDQLGVLLNIHYKNDTPISFLTNGQRVPEDLLIPSPADIAELIITDHGYPTHG
jgi:flagellar biosynthesis protein FlhF